MEHLATAEVGEIPTGNLSFIFVDDDNDSDDVDNDDYDTYNDDSGDGRAAEIYRREGDVCDDEDDDHDNDDDDCYCDCDDDGECDNDMMMMMMMMMMVMMMMMMMMMMIQVKFNEIEAQKFQNLSDLLMDNYSLIQTGPSRKNGAGDGIIVSGADGADGDDDSSSIASSNQLPSIEPSRSRCLQMEDQQAGHGDSSDDGGHHHSHRLSPLPSINNSSTPAALSMFISSSSSSNDSVKIPPNGHGTITRSSSKLSCSSSKPDFQRTPTLKNVDDLFDMLGISDSDSTRSMKNNNNSSSKASKLLTLSTRQQYAPTQGVLKESETETIMYR